MKRILYGFLVLVVSLLALPALGQQAESPKYDLTREPVLYTVGYAHLDTEWRWDYEETVNSFLKATLDDNFKMFETYKPYVFTLSGARRYKMMKEYYPEKYEKLKKYVLQDRWKVGGSSVDECDANIPSPESIIRQVLYGNGYFRAEFNKESVDFLLPDCFGFQASLPSVLAHAGLKGFSTQKLVWGSAVGIPFNIGTWKGPDGNGVVAALNATDYGGEIEPGLDTAKYWVDRVMENGKKYGVYADYRYYGTGDVGGSPRSSDIKNAVAAAGDPDGKIKVYLASSDQLFRDLTPEEVAKLPTYSGDLLLTQHSAGSLTSEAYMKRWNRKNELLAQAAEPVAVMADWLGGIQYPREALNAAWWVVLGSQMHDILPGTCIPKAYEYAWNDEVIGLNRFSSVLEASAGVVIRGLDTRSEGKSMVVYNSLPIAREDIVEAEIAYPEGAPDNIIVKDASGLEVPVQMINRTKTSAKFIILAKVPSLGFAVFDVLGSKTTGITKPGVITGSDFIENDYYKVIVDANGDISSIMDKTLKKEVLSGPSRLEFLKEHPEYWPAWNMDWKDRKNPPVSYVSYPAKITLVENGPVRATFKIEREGMNSKFITYIQLAAGEAGKRVEVRNTIAWQSKGVSLKASFPFNLRNKMATYNLGLGTIERETNNEKKFEVPSREWFDITDKSGSWGVSVLEDSKFGSDKPNDSTLRLTMLYTPATNFFHDQATQDWGTHEITYGLYSHKGDWRTGQSEWQGRRMNQPLRAFLAPSHPGFLGKTFSFAKISNPMVDIRAFKESETGDYYVIRLQELSGKELKQVELSLTPKITSAWLVDGQERKTGDLTPQGGKLVFDMKPFAIMSIAVKLEPPATRFTEPVSSPVAFIYDQDVITSDKSRTNGRIDNLGVTIPGELFPGQLTVDGILFVMGGKADNQFNVIACKGQKIALPKTGNYNKLYILAAASKDTSGLFRAGESKKMIRVSSITGKIGQADNRRWDKLGRITGVDPGYIKRDEVAWFAPHLHNDTSNIPYQYAYIYLYEIDAGPASGTLVLPDNDAIKIFAITAAENPYADVIPVQPLYDDFSGRKKMDLIPGKRYVNADMTGQFEVTDYEKKNLDELPVKVTTRDYAGIHMPNGVTVVYYQTAGDPIAEGKTFDAEPVSAINDGMFDLLPSDSVNDAWSDNAEGRLLMDLQRNIQIDSLHLFTTMDTRRGPQRFSMWGLPAGKQVNVNGDPKSAGWTLFAEVQPVDMWGNSKAVYRMVPYAGITPQYRYLMWINEDSGTGPFYFREVDVFEKQN